MSSTVENAILSPSNTGLPVTVDDMRAVATAHGDAIDIRTLPTLNTKVPHMLLRKSLPSIPAVIFMLIFFHILGYKATR